MAGLFTCTVTCTPAASQIAESAKAGHRAGSSLPAGPGTAAHSHPRVAAAEVPAVAVAIVPLWGRGRHMSAAEAHLQQGKL